MPCEADNLRDVTPEILAGGAAAVVVVLRSRAGERGDIRRPVLAEQIAAVYRVIGKEASGTVARRLIPDYHRINRIDSGVAVKVCVVVFHHSTTVVVIANRDTVLAIGVGRAASHNSTDDSNPGEGALADVHLLDQLADAE